MSDNSTPYGFSTLDEMLDKLRAYLKNPDDDTIRLKSKVEQMLKGCPELLWALNSDDYLSQLFNEDGSLNETGEWEVYF